MKAAVLVGKQDINTCQIMAQDGQEYLVDLEDMAGGVDHTQATWTDNVQC